MTSPGSLTPGELRVLLREHTAVLAPGEVLVVMVPPTWTPREVGELQTALRAVCGDPEWLGARLPVLVVPGTAIGVAQMPPDPFTE